MQRMAPSDPSKGLKEKRKEINSIDQKLLNLLNHRLSIALEIGTIKKRMGVKIHDSSREREVLEGLKTKNRGPLKEEDLEKIFRTIMGVCRRSQM
jgi:chorismate mutase/prephenate dehydratase